MVDVMDDSFVVADRRRLAARLADPALWRRWWPALELTVVEDRGLEGVRWSVAGALSGSAEIWLEGWHDGVLVHWFLRADPPPRTRRRSAARLQRSYVAAYKRRIHRLKDELESGRPVGTPREGGTSGTLAVPSHDKGISHGGADDLEHHDRRGAGGRDGRDSRP